MPVFLIATLDTKGAEAAFLRDELGNAGVDVRVVDAGCLGAPVGRADVAREQVFAAAGASLATLQQKNDRGLAVDAAARGAEALISKFYKNGDVDGVIGLGGGAGTTIATAAMRALPIGVPKLMISTLASGQVSHFVGGSDIFMLNAVVDISGLNRVSRAVLARAAQAMAGMSRAGALRANANDRPLVAASMFGVTTPCVERARAVLEEGGFEVLVFHATGAGGRTLESLAAGGMLAGVLDITTTELADELVGGFLSAGPTRLTAAGARGIPQVVSAGALDMVNFHGMESVPQRFRGRQLYQHNMNVTLMRTTSDECRALGREIGAKTAAARGPVEILFPERGISDYDREGRHFNDPAARTALLEGMRETAGAVPVRALNLHINDPEFAETAARTLIAMIQNQKLQQHSSQ
ncbi:MAG: Tm-1-like ATP-binding domain-containing protein [Planctomycetes bacterium]|nr:Tm-1-like ATP-binding domain-containing protein [Planctomycetota bacterium]